MVVLEIFGAVLIFALGLSMTVALYVGLLGVLGAVRLVRCDRCGHLGPTSAREPLRSCPHCRHGLLLHPLQALHHHHQEQLLRDIEGSR